MLCSLDWPFFLRRHTGSSVPTGGARHPSPWKALLLAGATRATLALLAAGVGRVVGRWAKAMSRIVKWGFQFLGGEAWIDRDKVRLGQGQVTS